MKTAAVILLCFLFVALASAGKTAVRVAHASPDAPNVDVYVNGTLAFSDLAFKDITNYAFVPADYYNIVVVPAGASSPVVINATVYFE